MRGNVFNLDGDQLAEDEPIDNVFLAVVKTALAAEPVFVVLGTGIPADFEAKVAELGAPVVHDPRLESGALVVAGDPSEWAELSA